MTPQSWPDKDEPIPKNVARANLLAAPILEAPEQEQRAWDQVPIDS